MKQMSIMMSVLLFVILGCNEELTKEQGHSHAPGEQAHSHSADHDEVLSKLYYSDQLELFVQYQPLVVDHVSEFATHVTILGKNFLPLKEGEVTVSLIVGDKGIKNTLEQPKSPGLFLLALKPTKSGIGKLIFDIKSAEINDQFIIENVLVFANDNEAHNSLHSEELKEEISFSKEQAWTIEFANEEIKYVNFNDVLHTSGQILPAAGEEVFVTAKASGIVIFSNNNTILGTELNKGSKLFTISGGDMAHGNIDSEFKNAKSTYAKSKSDFDNASILVKENIISQKEFLRIKAEYEIAQTNYNNISKYYSSGGQSITSPMKGFVKNILVSEGEYVTEGTALATIAKNGKLILQANVSQKYFGKLSSIKEANFKTVNSSIVYNTSELEGKVSYGKSANPNSPFIPVSFQINNSGDLISGSNVEVFLKSSQIEKALVIPMSALIEEQGIFYAYIQSGGESFEKRTLELGARDGVEVQVLSGINEGERVVTKGAFQIKLSSAAGTIPAHGHTH